MKHSIVFLVFAIAMMAGAASFAQTTGIPDMENSWVEFYSGAQPSSDPVLFNVPNGMGSAFTEAQTFEGPFDATLVLHLRDSNNDPIVNFPAEDLLQTHYLDYCLTCVCPGGTTPEYNTDINGETTWVNPLRAGNWVNPQPITVLVSGISLANGGPVLGANSPDINGDSFVNLMDIVLFTVDYYGGYALRSDFQYDGVINLADVTKIAQSIGATCP